MTPKVIVDGEQDANTGSVLELEIGWIINRRWSTWLMLGTRLWGEGIPAPTTNGWNSGGISVLTVRILQNTQQVTGLFMSVMPNRHFFLLP